MNSPRPYRRLNLFLWLVLITTAFFLPLGFLHGLKKYESAQEYQPSDYERAHPELLDRPARASR